MATIPPTTTSSATPGTPPTLSSRIRASLFGLAVTDALGAPIEFSARNTFPLVTNMLTNTNFRVHCSQLDPSRPIDDESYLPLPPGCFTDDTSMALCLAHSLINCNGKSDLIDQVRNYLWWFQHGWMSSVGECFDVGAATSSALKQWAGLLKEYDARFPRSATSTSASPDLSQEESDKSAEETEFREMMLEKVATRLNAPHRCGNGSLMRVLPCALIAHTTEEAINLAIRSSMPTHPHQLCLDSCALYTRLVYAALKGRSKEETCQILNDQITRSISSTPPSDCNTPTPTFLHPDLIQRFLKYNSLEKWQSTPSSEIKSGGFVLDTLEAALWAFFTTSTFRDGAIKVVNLGDDADTVGAVYGGLAGAFYGVEEIPDEWAKGLWGKSGEMVEEVAEGIVERRGLT